MGSSLGQSRRFCGVPHQAKAQQAMQGYYAGVTHIDKQVCSTRAVHVLCTCCACGAHVHDMSCGVHAGRDAGLPVPVGGAATAGGACLGGPVGEDDRAACVGPRVEAG